MTYRVFSGPKGSPDIPSQDKGKMLYKEFGALDEAFAWSRHLALGGRVALLLEGDDSTRLDRRQIGEALGVGQRESIGA